MAFEDADAAEVGCSGGIACGDWGSPRLGHPRLAASIQFDGQWGSASLPPPLGPADGSFSAPSRAATDSSNSVYVTDSGNSRVQKFSSTGTFLSKFGTLGIGNGQFLTGSASGVAIDSAGNVYVVDKLSNRVQKFSATRPGRS